MMTIDLMTYTPEIIEIKCIDDTAYDEYVIKACDSHGVFIQLSKSDKPTFTFETAKILGRYSQLICFATKNSSKTDEETVISKPYDLRQIYVSEERLIAIKSYNGITLIFPHPVGISDKPLYDEYQFYIKKNEQKTRISSDITFTSNIAKLDGDSYIAEAYSNEDGKHILRHTATATKEILEMQMNKLTGVHSVEATMFSDLTICIPLYKHATMLPRCIDSILANQCYGMHNKKLSIILINDKSPDDSDKVGKWYADNYPNIIYRELDENKGQAHARNYGVQFAKQKVKPRYIAFCDDDDCVHPYSYSTLINEADKNQADMAIMRTYIIRTDNSILTHLKMNDSNIRVFSSLKEYVENHYGDESMQFDAVWCRIMKADIAYQCKAPERDDYPDHDNTGWYEDTGMIKSVMTHCNRIIIVKNALYVWDQRIRNTEHGSGTSRMDKTNDSIVWRDWAFCHIVYPLVKQHKTDKDHDDIALWYILQHPIHYLYDNCMDTPNRLTTTHDSVTRSALVLKHMLKNYDITHNKYLDDKYQLRHKLETILICADNADEDVIQELNKTNYLRANIK